MVKDPMLTLAELAGANALTVFFVVLLTALILATAGWWFFHGKFMLRARTKAPDVVYFICNVLGLILLIGAVVIFIEIADGIAVDSGIALIDATVTNSIKTHATAIPLHIFAVVTHFGDRPVLFAIGVLVTVLLWQVRRRPLAIGWAFTLAGNAVLNPILKHFFERLRPLNEHGMANALGWSFPSGHASGAMVTYGMLGYVALRTLPSVCRLPVVLGVISLVLSVGFSRIFLQVHFASDVAAGFASGLAWLSICIMTIELIEHYYRIKGSST
jgi:membrane-associated phospholipid phosphatase